jgi:hypothetical protein
MCGAGECFGLSLLLLVGLAAAAAGENIAGSVRRMYPECIPVVWVGELVPGSESSARDLVDILLARSSTVVS